MVEREDRYRVEQEYVYRCSIAPITTARDLLGTPVVERTSLHKSAVSLQPLNLDLVPALVIAEYRDIKPKADQARTIRGYNQIVPSIEYTMLFADAMAGPRFNQLLLQIAPSPDIFGLDPNDVMTDWGRLYNKEANYLKLREHHRLFGHAWSALERHGLAQLAAFKQDGLFRVPILRWRNYGKLPSSQADDDYDGQDRDLLYSPLPRSNEGGAAVNDFIRPITDGANILDYLDPVVGQMYLAYYSPDIVSKWPRQASLPDRLKSTMNQGTTQVPLIITLHRDDLLKGPLLHVAERHTGIHY